MLAADGNWSGSSIDITCELGRIKLFYVDEMEEKLKEKEKGKESTDAQSSKR